jgi:sulfocyanin SoxE-like protein
MESMPRLRTTLALVVFLLYVVGCDPVMGTGSGTPPDPKGYMRADAGSRAVVVTLVAGYPASDFQFNYDGYGNGSLVVSIPVGWQVTVQCENRGTVPNSCAVVSGRSDVKPIEPGWSTPDPLRGLDPGQSASFIFSPTNPGSYRIASLVGGNEASGMWADLEVTAGGTPTMAATG